MAQSIEASGKTIEQALQRALKELGARPEDVDIEIVSESGGGLLGIFGSKSVKIRVSLRESKQEANSNALIREIIDKVLGLMGIDFTATVEEMPDTTFININSDGLDGLLIGRRGETLASIQHVVNRIFTSRTSRHSKVTVDVGGYIKRKHRLLIEKAQKVAERVRKTHKEYDFEPLKASERRIIHLAIAEVDDVTTYTIGDGLLRKVVITPKNTGVGDRDRDRGRDRDFDRDQDFERE
jgi:spoIIIJ-associated protein